MSDLLTLDWEGKKYSLDIQSVTVSEYRAIKVNLGLKQGEFINSFTRLDALDADAVVALLWLCQKRAGLNVTLQDYDDVATLAVMAGIGSPDVPEVEADPKAGDATPTAG